MNSEVHEGNAFDFDKHKQDAIERYRTLQTKYESFANKVQEILRTSISESTKIATIESRAKSLDSFGEKATTPQHENPNLPKYPNPLNDIEDIAAARVITFFLRDVTAIDAMIDREFCVLERQDKSDALLQGGLVGYHSIHYVVRLRCNRTSLPEYAVYDGLKSEIQLRTVLQHAWAEIEHDIQYKTKEDVPRIIRQRFANLAGLLAIADREFQSVHDEEEEIRRETETSVQTGRLDEVQITAESLKMYADDKLGEDGRISQWSYDWFARLLRKLGFGELGEVDEMIREFNDDELSRVIHGSRQGQLSRLEDMLLVKMGEKFIEGHFWRSEEWFREGCQRRLKAARAAGFSSAIP